MINIVTVYCKEKKLTDNMEDHCKTWFQQFHFLNCKGLQHWHPFPREEFSLHQAIQPAERKHHMLTFQYIWYTKDQVINNLTRDRGKIPKSNLWNINLPDIHAQKVLARKYKEEDLWVAIYGKLL
jgi:hypothetical protein